jgi:uncharacterized damage-inducible protein DinB
MTPDQASILLQANLAAYESEIPITRKIIAAVPENQKTYKPHEKNMSADELAWHIASAEVWFLNSIADKSFAMGDDSSSRPPELNTIASIVSWYDENVPKALARVKAMSGEDLATTVDFFGVMSAPVVAYLSVCNVHSIHHRGQLSVYLRPMGAKVPSIYGGSADEPFQSAAGQ